MPGDWVVIATTSFSPFETEFAHIASVDATKTVLTLDAPLVYYHFGGADPGAPPQANFNATRETNWGVDERAGGRPDQPQHHIDVATIRITGRSFRRADDLSQGSFKEASVQGVEFALLGRPKLGTYPVHFHMDGSLGRDQVLFNANSIHHSFNKCITVHSTKTLLIQNNVCARAVGHLFYEEIGDEEDITFAYNLGLGAMSNNFDIHPQKDFSLREPLINRYWWPGDRMAREAGFGADFFAFNVGNHDHQFNPTHGSCRDPLANGGLGGGVLPCKASSYFEPASGFWIIQSGHEFDPGNSIGGCQGVGRGMYWYVPLFDNARRQRKARSGQPQIQADRRVPQQPGAFLLLGPLRGTRRHVGPRMQLLPHLGGTLKGAFGIQ